MTEISEIADEPASSGTTALEGFIYQKSVSVWIALDLVMVRKAARQVILEPVKQDDLEADIESEPGAMAQTTPLDDYTLVVQCKLKSTGPWTHQEIGRLLSHGKPPGRRADNIPPIMSTRTTFKMCRSGLNGQDGSAKRSYV